MYTYGDLHKCPEYKDMDYRPYGINSIVIFLNSKDALIVHSNLYFDKTITTVDEVLNKLYGERKHDINKRG